MYVLLIDDNTELAGSLADFLEEYGYELDFAYSGSSGVELARPNPPLLKNNAKMK